MPYSWSWSEASLLGSILSATDPVAGGWTAALCCAALCCAVVHAAAALARPGLASLAHRRFAALAVQAGKVHLLFISLLSQLRH